MPQFDPASFGTQLFWLAITFAALYVGISRLVLPRVVGVLEARQKRIDDDLDKAAALKHEAETVLAEYEKARAEAEAKAQALIREAQEGLAGEAAKQHERLSAELAEHLAAAEARISAAKEEAKSEIGAVAAEIAAAATRRLIGTEVSEAEAGAAITAKAKEGA